jgi:hypothetical protein
MAIKELESLPAKTNDKVIAHLRQLEENPRIPGAEKLTAFSRIKTAWKLPDHFRDRRRLARNKSIDDRRSPTGLQTP